VGAVRVLLVDDQQTFRHAMAAVVAETAGFEVVGEASTGEESVALAGSLRPDLVLMDVNLPGIDGMEATRRLREHTPPPVVLLLSTYDEESAAQFVGECGAAGYVTKADLAPERLAALWPGSRD
jgi:DNA-binding NarL/FixJ family response regulator